MEATLELVPARLIAANKDMLVNAVRQSMRETAFSNRMLLAPRRLQEIGQQEAEACLSYLETLDLGVVQERGKQLALKGLGHRSVLALTSVLRRVFLQVAELDSQSWSAFLDTVDSYNTALMEGYMAGCEEDVRRETERTRQAYERSLESQS